MRAASTAKHTVWPCNNPDRPLQNSKRIFAKKLRALPVEAIARGYLIGSGWKDYQRSGAVCGIELPAGLRQAEILPEPIFTPST